MAADLIRDTQSPQDDKSDQMSNSWRDDSYSPSPTVSDSGSVLSSSNSSVVGDDSNGSSPLSTRLFFSQNGHKKLNRSQSEPRGRRHLGNMAPSRYKTELCHPFEENGSCKYGEKCQFAHGVHELRDLARHPKYKTELCRTFHAEGYCPYGTRCHFIHERNLDRRCVMPGLMSASSVTSVKDLSMSPNSLSSLSPASSINAFPFASATSFCSPPPSPVERLPIFNEISPPAPARILPFIRPFGGLTA